MVTTLIRRVVTACLYVLVLLSTVVGSVYAAVSIDKGGRVAAAFLPEGTPLDPSIPTPESVLGANVGEWHVRHDQLVSYMYQLANASPRVTIEETGRTHENRPLLLLTITAPENHSNIDAIQSTHVNSVVSGNRPAGDAPLVIYMGYSVHGNEPSGANASLIVAYYLAAAQSADVEKMLNENVVLLDPSFNPDGLSRFAQWANMHKGKQLVADPQHREHDEGWPSGRTNHYWFDLNRDWLLLTHPESRARIAKFHQWRPHVLTDFHEMGTNSTYFFQPGVRSRKNPLTPDGNVTLTEALAKYHAKALDTAGELYFTEEAFDDFYVGKGSTYPDIHGSVGILFEQASSRGHLQSSINGPVAFADTIANQVTTSLSTFEGAVANKAALLDYQVTFVKSTEALIENDTDAGYLIEQPKDTGRFTRFLALLTQHNIRYDVVNRDITLRDKTFEAKNAIYIPLDQPQYRLIKSLFSTQTNFENNTFYDVSSWHIAYAFNLEYQSVSQRDARGVKTAANIELAKPELPDALPEGAYAYGFGWDEYYAPAFLQALLEHDISTRITSKSFTATLVDGSRHQFAPGSVVIPRSGNEGQPLAEYLVYLAKQFDVPVYALKSGLTPAGVDLGSRSIVPTTPPSVLIVGGEGTREYDVGEIWHLFDTRIGLATSIVEQAKLASTSFMPYTHIVFANGRYQLSEQAIQKLEHWINQGGVVIGQKSALRFLSAQGWLDAEVVDNSVIDAAFDTDDLAFAEKDALYARKLVAGTVYQANIDVSHPLFYGFDSDTLPLFKTSNMIISNDYSPFTTPAVYSGAPLLSGFSDKAMVNLIADSPAVVTTRVGNGLVIGFVDNTQFRGYWHGTNKMMANAIYMWPFMR
ncbi:M14 metallopeptidase family protein [Alteromonas sp. KUL49]|uniref:M14 metallopeptidase family protein n=1 Tax=Alteromonas sp. KUL49 TaxID=2480798 RepID=UPI00102F1868|nr:M14 metallopeptidase family protein [Alteromonas sp. KUL49]TAP42167.1 peptidase M14 [Alteromonas sp. KUL49]GEA09751.1 peptidase M14 [Alteromonas sp. KUL49]